MGLPLLFVPVAGPVLVQGAATAPRGQRDAAPLGVHRGQRDAAPIPQNLAPTALVNTGTKGAALQIVNPQFPHLRGQRDAAPISLGRGQRDAAATGSISLPVPQYTVPLLFLVQPTATFGRAGSITGPTRPSSVPGATTNAIQQALGALQQALSGGEAEPGTITQSLGGLRQSIVAGYQTPAAIAQSLGGLRQALVGGEAEPGTIAQRLSGLRQSP